MSASFDVTIRTLLNGKGNPVSNYHTKHVTEVEGEKRTKYQWIGTTGGQGQAPALFAPLVFSPMGYVSDEVIRLCWILGSLQAKQHVEQLEGPPDNEDEDSPSVKFYRSSFFRQTVARLQVAAVVMGARRYRLEQPFIRGVYRDRAYEREPVLPVPPPMDVSLSLSR